jgi:hypothetical protein
MSTIDGRWALTTKTPMGDQLSTLTLATEGGVLTGTDESKQGTYTLLDGTVNGNAIGWRFDVAKPFPLRLVFKATVDGDVLTGTVKAGALGTAKISATRIA